MSEQSSARDRRAAIADAGIGIIAAQGVRALTHRAVDSALGLSSGSTSYYARTRRDLVVLIVGRLAARTTAEMSEVPWPEQLTVDTVASLVARAVEAASQREDDHVARIALRIEYRNDDEIRTVLEGDPPVRPRLIAAAERCLVRLGVPDAAEASVDFVSLVDGMLMQSVVRGSGGMSCRASGVEEIVRNYLSGLVR